MNQSESILFQARFKFYLDDRSRRLYYLFPLCGHSLKTRHLSLLLFIITTHKNLTPIFFTLASICPYSCLSWFSPPSNFLSAEETRKKFFFSCSARASSVRVYYAKDHQPPFCLLAACDMSCVGPDGSGLNIVALCFRLIRSR